MNKMLLLAPRAASRSVLQAALVGPSLAHSARIERSAWAGRTARMRPVRAARCQRRGRSYSASGTSVRENPLLSNHSKQHNPRSG